MKRLIFLFISIFLIFTISSCSGESEDSGLATSYSDIFEVCSNKSYTLNYLSDEIYTVTLSDTISYTYEELSDEDKELNDYDFEIKLTYGNNIYTFDLDGTFNKILYVNDNIYLVRYVYDYEQTGDIYAYLVLSQFVDGSLVDVFTVRNCYTGAVFLYYEDEYYHFYYFNSSTCYFVYAKLDLNKSLDESLIETRTIAAVSYIRDMIYYSYNKFYYIDAVSLYLYEENGDGKYTVDDITFIDSKITHAYKDSDNQAHFYEVKATNYLVNTTMLIRNIVYTYNENKDNYTSEKTDIINKGLVLRYFDYVTYGDKIFFIFNDFLGIFEYDCNDNTFYGYYDTSVKTLGFNQMENNLLIQVEKDGNNFYYSLDLTK